MKKNKMLNYLLIIFTLICINTFILPKNSLSEISKGPYLQNVTNNSIVIIWESNDGSNNCLSFCSSNSCSAENGIHEAKIDGLNSNTPYSYNMIVNDIPTKHSFTTAPNPDNPINFTFSIVGDTQVVSDTTYLKAVVDGISTKSPDILIHLGDIVQDGGSSVYWQTFFDYSIDLLSVTPMFPTPGNHEYINDPGALNFFNYFSLPHEAGATERGWYTFVYGNVRFISLDTQALSEEQDNWLVSRLVEANLPEAKEEWIVVYFHQPPITSNKIDLNTYVRDNWIPLFQKYGVNLVLSGHTHNYQRYEDSVYGTVYIVSGGGNNFFDNVNPNYKPPRGIVKKAEKTNTIHYDVVDVFAKNSDTLTTNDKLNFVAYNALTGESFDSFTLAYPIELHVKSINTSTFTGQKPLVYGKTLVTIVDEYGNPVSDALVSGKWTGLNIEDPVSATTGDDGVATFITPTQFKKQSFGFSVTNVTKGVMNYITN